MDKYIGKRLDARYEVNELIGVGGMSLVYRAYDVIEAQSVAIKILKDEYFGNSEFMKRFKNESRAVAVLSHPNIVKVLNVSFGTNFQYIVMEYISGITLKEYISKKGQIDWKESVQIITQVLKALAHAHSRGVIHRDIKPQNIMITDDNVVKVTDFGIARFFTNETQTMTDKTIGSVHYISPEQAKGLKTDVKSDIYSVGIVLYEMLTNRLPFEADNAVSVAIMQMQVVPQSPRALNQSIPPALEEITLKAMQKNPEKRYFAAESMLEDIEKFTKNVDVKFGYNCFVDENPTKVLPESPNEEELEEKSRKKKALFITGGIAAALVLFALVFMFITMFTSYGNSKNVDVPNFIGRQISDVQNDKKYKFDFKIERVYEASQPDGVIIDQDPKAGAKQIKANGSIILKVNSSGITVAVPMVVGLSEEEAKSKITNAGLIPEVMYVNDSNYPIGKVKSVEPYENSKVPTNSNVKIYVNKASTSDVKVPNVVGKSFDEAKSELSNLGLKISSDIKYEDSDEKKDTVISIDPLPGVYISHDGTVKLTLSSGVKKEKTIALNVDWSDLPEFHEDVNIKVYVNGELDSEKSTTVDSSVTNKTFYFKGTQGTKKIKVKINNYERNYTVNFDEYN